MAYPDVAQFALTFQDTQGLGHTQVGMSHHAEDRVDTPVHHGFHHHMADSPLRAFGCGNQDKDTVFAQLNFKGLDIVVFPQGFTGNPVKGMSVPGASKRGPP